MEIEDYKLAKENILNNISEDGRPNQTAKNIYYNLLNIFVQDCHLPVSQKYFGNLTKQKAQILFDLSEFFIGLPKNDISFVLNLRNQ